MSDNGWNFADVWETITDVQPDKPVTVHGDRRSTWAEFDRRADGVARTLLDAGVERQDKVAQYLYNCPEYLESVYASMKAGLVPVNTNYRYGNDELVYLWDNADAVAVMFHGAFTERIESVRHRVPSARLWLWVDDGSGPCPDWAQPYEDAAKAGKERVAPPWGRSGDDLYMLYTGGTTGMPKGVMWRQDDLYVAFSEAVMQGLLGHHPGMRLVDAFSSSEALGMGQSISTAGGAAKTAKFALGDRARVITDDGRDVQPGSGDVGRVAVRGRCPVGYYKDAEKSARTFPVIDGQRYSVPGDYATVEADGTLRLLGRGSVCINTGGEKVYPEEVEEVLKEHPAIRDAVVVGVPDDRFGEVICAWVEPVDGLAVEEGEVIAYVKGRLAGYKAPRRVLSTPTIGRSPAGQVD